MTHKEKQLTEQRDRLRAALDKTWRILESDELKGSVQMANIHGFSYKGGFFTRAEYEAAIADPPNEKTPPLTYPLDQVPIPEGWEQCGFREPKFDECFLTETGEIGCQDGSVSFKGREAKHIIVRNEGEENDSKDV